MRTVVALALVGLLAACGSGDGGKLAQGPSTPAAAGTDLRIVVTATPGAQPRAVTLTCDPAGGDHPDPAAACAVLEDDHVLDPLPSGRICTQQFGGPETARITGLRHGRSVDLRLSRSNGCTMAQWDALGPVLPR